SSKCQLSLASESGNTITGWRHPRHNGPKRGASLSDTRGAPILSASDSNRFESSSGGSVQERQTRAAKRSMAAVAPVNTMHTPKNQIPIHHVSGSDIPTAAETRDRIGAFEFAAPPAPASVSSSDGFPGPIGASSSAERGCGDTSTATEGVELQWLNKPIRL